MKRKFLITLVLFLSATCLQAAGRHMDEMWDTANTLYVNGDYSSAIMAYEEIANEGYAGSKLYYNLGNAYFKDNKLGKAILNYNKAQRLAPYDKDIEYNLAVANSYIKDRIEPVPDLFINGAVRKLRMSLSSNVWAVISLVLLAAIAACVLVYMLSVRKGRRKAGFFTAIALAVLFAVTVSFSAIERKELVDSSQAVVVVSAISVKSSPDDAGKDLFIIHEGTKVDVTASFGAWTEVMIANGNKGWLRDSAMEYID
jgi:DNA uptake lipoprotein